MTTNRTLRASSARTFLAAASMVAAILAASQVALAASTVAGIALPLPNLSVALPGGNGGTGGGPGGGGSSGSTGGGYPGAPAPGGINLQLTGSGFSDGRAADAGPNDRFGDPLSTDLLGDGRLHAKLRYYGESSSGIGTTQAVGLNFVLSQ